MPRRVSHKLSLQQRERINAIQERRVERMAARQKQESETLLRQSYGAEEEGVVVTHFGFNVEVEDSAGQRLRCAVRETLTENPVCGDRVIWQRAGEEQGVILAIQPRCSVLRRPAAHERLQTLAANVDQLLVTTIALRFNPGLVDRYLVAAEAAGITPLILINKIDQIEDKEDLKFIKELSAVYEKIGYRVIRLSATTGQGMNKLEKALQDKISVFVGQSGVGKSSLIAHWIHDETIRTAEVHAETGQGRHTTSTTRLYALDRGGALIDSPGVRSFGLHGVAPSQVAGYFRDIAPYLGRCHFSDCRHLNEPDCAILKAVEKGAIDPDRLESMQRIIDSLTTPAGAF